MVDLDCLYRFAEDNNIPVISFSLPVTGSVAIQANPEKCYIGMDEETIVENCNRCVRLAHELGHCMTGAFYNKYAACDVRQKHENRADIWAIEHKLSSDDLDNAVAEGYTEIWSLAEYFEVTEDFMKKAVCWYTYGNLDVELYF